MVNSVTTEEPPLSLFEELRQATLLQHEEGDLPEWLLTDILKVVDSPGRYACRQQFVRHLIDQVRGYDPYAGAGCFSTSFGPEDIRRTLRQLLS
jgi:hypothetical protein